MSEGERATGTRGGANESFSGGTLGNTMWRACVREDGKMTEECKLRWEISEGVLFEYKVIAVLFICLGFLFFCQMLWWFCFETKNKNKIRIEVMDSNNMSVIADKDASGQSHQVEGTSLCPHLHVIALQNLARLRRIAALQSAFQSFHNTTTSAQDHPNRGTPGSSIPPSSNLFDVCSGCGVIIQGNKQSNTLSAEPDSSIIQRLMNVEAKLDAVLSSQSRNSSDLSYSQQNNRNASTYRRSNVSASSRNGRGDVSSVATTSSRETATHHSNTCAKNKEPHSKPSAGASPSKPSREWVRIEEDESMLDLSDDMDNDTSEKTKETGLSVEVSGHLVLSNDHYEAITKMLLSALRGEPESGCSHHDDRDVPDITQAREMSLDFSQINL